MRPRIPDIYCEVCGGLMVPDNTFPDKWWCPAEESGEHEEAD